MRKYWSKLGALAAALLLPAMAHAQGVVQQAGPVVPFHPAAFGGNGVVMDGGTNAAPAIDTLSMFGGANCPLTISSQTGPGVSLSPSSQFSVCQSLTASTLTFLGLNGASAPAVYFDIGGTTYAFPGPGNGNVLGPGSAVSNNAACFNTTSGTLLKDCGATVPLYSSNAAVSGVTMGTTNLLQPAGVTYSLTSEGGIFTGSTYCYLCVGQNWSAGNTSGATGGPVSTIFAYAADNQATVSAVAVAGDCNVTVSSGYCSAANFIARTNGGGVTDAKLVSAEFDCEPSIGDTVAATSICMPIVAFTTQIPVSIQIGGVSGGSFNDAVVINNSTFGVVAGSSESGTVMFDTTEGTFTGGSLRTGCGIGNGVQLGSGGGGISPFLYCDVSNDLLSQLGSTDVFAIKNHSGANELVFTGITSTGGLALTPTTASSSTATGALTDAGGLGVAGAAYIGGAVNVTATTAASSTTTGAVIDSGGLGVAGAGYFGGAVLSSGAGGVGYVTGAGSTVTQATSRTTGVTINAPTGQITIFSAAGSATPATFTVSDTSVAATDTVVLNESAGTNLYEFFVTSVSSHAFNITFFTTGGTSSDAPVINFAVVKGSAN